MKRLSEIYLEKHCETKQRRSNEVRIYINKS